MFLLALINAPNVYEKKKETEKEDKESKAERVRRLLVLCLPVLPVLRYLPMTAIQSIVAIISILLFARNRATNAFQLVTGIWLTSAGAGKRVFDVLNHMGVSVSYQYVSLSYFCDRS